MDISVIIVNYNVKEYIISCIDSIYKHSKSKYQFEIIIIDNNSKDGSVNEISKRFPEILLIDNKYNAGFSRAVNQGANKSNGEFLFILNPDTLLLEDTLTILLDEAKTINNLCAIGPMLVSEKYEKHQSYWAKPTLINTLLSIFHLDFLNIKKNYNYKDSLNKLKVDSISGGAFFVRTKIFNQLKGFNEDLFWMEDIDFCVRAEKNKYKIFYFPFTKVLHYVGKSAKQNFTKSISSQLLSKIKFFRIHHSKISTFFILISILIISTIKGALFFLIAPLHDQSGKKARGYIYTIKSIIFKK